MKPSGGNETSAAVLWGISWREYREPFGHENVTRSFGTAIGVSQVGPNAVESTSVDSFGRVWAGPYPSLLGMRWVSARGWIRRIACVSV